MDTSLEQQETETTQRVSFSNVLHSALGVFGWVNWFFTLTKEEQSEAGINFNSSDLES
jgi:hypothetical protein